MKEKVTPISFYLLALWKSNNFILFYFKNWTFCVWIE